MLVIKHFVGTRHDAGGFAYITSRSQHGHLSG